MRSILLVSHTFASPPFLSGRRITSKNTSLPFGGGGNRRTVLVRFDRILSQIGFVCQEKFFDDHSGRRFFFLPLKFFRTSVCTAATRAARRTHTEPPTAAEPRGFGASQAPTSAFVLQKRIWQRITSPILGTREVGMHLSETQDNRRPQPGCLPACGAQRCALSLQKQKENGRAGESRTAPPSLRIFVFRDIMWQKKRGECLLWERVFPKSR